MLDKDTLLDKVIELDKQEETKDSFSITAELIKKRDELKKEIEQKLAGIKPDEDKDTTDIEGTEDSPNTNSEDTAETVSAKDKDIMDKSSDSEDKTSIADSLSGSKDKSAEPDAGEKKEPNIDDLDDIKMDDSSEVAKESLTLIRKAAIGNFFAPYIDAYNKRIEYLKTLKLPMSSRLMQKNLSMEEQPIVYTKDKALESFKNVVSTISIYNKTSKNIANSFSIALKAFMEQATIYQVYLEKERLQFTSKLIDNKEILVNLAIDSNLNLKESLRNITRFNEDTLTLTKFMLNNSLEAISGSLHAANFVVDEDRFEYRYRESLPGFNDVSISVTEYTNFIKTKLASYIAYTTQTVKPSEYYSLPSLAVKDETNLSYILEYVNKEIASLGIIVDNLDSIDKLLTSILDDIKIKVYDLENDRIQDYSSLGIDDVLKNIIKAKLALELNLVGININNKFLTAIFSALKETTELK